VLLPVNNVRYAIPSFIPYHLLFRRSSLSFSVFVFLCISAVDLQQEMSDVMKETWDAESKLREIGEIIEGVIKEFKQMERC
jgi:hypothetical protein